MSLRPEVRARVRATVAELASQAGSARVATIELHYAIDALQDAIEKHGWPAEARELCEMTQAINSAITDIVQALFALAGKTQRLAAISDLVEPVPRSNGS